MKHMITEMVRMDTNRAVSRELYLCQSGLRGFLACMLLRMRGALLRFHIYTWRCTVHTTVHNPSCKRHSHNLDIKQYLELRLFLPLLKKGRTQLIKTHTELGQKIKIHPTG